MALYRYKKVDNHFLDSRSKYIEIKQDSKDRTTLWNTMGGGYDALQSLVNNSRIANLIIPSALVILGLFFIYRFVYPELQTIAQQAVNVGDQGSSAPVSSDYIDRSQFISNPAGLQDVAAEAFEQQILQEDITSRNYAGTFYISIPSLGIDSLPVTPNVDSTTEAVYNSVLKTSLAHFENTGLPISDVQNNMVIYGHSASPNYNPSPRDPEVAFSFLSNLRVGDEIFLDVEGKRYTYRMYKSKIVEPDDFSIITGERNKRTLTLFTCYPSGNNTSRYVALARPV